MSTMRARRGVMTLMKSETNYDNDVNEDNIDNEENEDNEDN